MDKTNRKSTHKEHKIQQNLRLEPFSFKKRVYAKKYNNLGYKERSSSLSTSSTESVTWEEYLEIPGTELDIA